MSLSLYATQGCLRENYRQNKMSSDIKLEIKFDNPSATYYSGDAVTGRIFVSCDSAKKIQAFSVCIKGYADVKWSESSGSGSSSSTDYYSSHEVYFEHFIHLLGGSGDDRTTLPAGENSYPFHTVLPPNLPSSFKTNVGYVQYCVEGLVSRPWKFDRKCMAVFTVLSPLDLNLFLEVQIPVQFVEEKSYNCCCCCCCCSKNESVSLVATLPRSGYLPNQEIPVTIELDNRSSMRVEDIVCTLKKVVIFRATTKNKIEPSVLATVRFGSIGQRAAQTWTKAVQIPELPPYNLTHCKIIDLKYELFIEVKLPSCQVNLRLAIPLTIGTEMVSNTSLKYS